MTAAKQAQSVVVTRRKQVARAIVKRLVADLLERPGIGPMLDGMRSSDKGDWRELVTSLEFHCTREMKLAADQWALEKMVAEREKEPKITELSGTPP